MSGFFGHPVVRAGLLVLGFAVWCALVIWIGAER